VGQVNVVYSKFTIPESSFMSPSTWFKGLEPLARSTKISTIDYEIYDFDEDNEEDVLKSILLESVLLKFSDIRCYRWSGGGMPRR